MTQGKKYNDFYLHEIRTVTDYRYIYVLHVSFY
jgi:hypothetical protein